MSVPVVPVAPAVRRLVLLSLLVLASSSSLGCARSHLFYDTRELRHEPLRKDQEAALNQFIAGKLGGRGVTWVDEDGRERQVAAGDVDKKLGLAERGALWLTLSAGELGGESDVRVRIAGARPGSTPVSVYIGLDGAVRVVSGKRERDDEAAPTPDEIRARFELDGKMPGKWADGERRALAQSLASLAPAELAVVKDVHFDRRHSPDAKNALADPSRAALYEMRGCRAVIFVYSSSIRADAFRFVGDAAAPKTAVLHSIVHEMGHAFEQHPARSRYCAAERAKGVAAKNEHIAAGNALVEGSPVLAAYLKVLDGAPAPTDYGNASAHESFAESFALFHVDPEALERTRPRVFAWFAKGGHIAAQKSAGRS